MSAKRPTGRVLSSRLIGLLLAGAIVLTYVFVLSRGAWP